MCTIPIIKCVENGREGYKFGESGHCYNSGDSGQDKRHAILQGVSYLGSKKVSQILKNNKHAKAFFYDAEGVAMAKAALVEYERESYTSKFVKSVASVVKGDDGQNNTGVNMGSMLDDPEDKGCADYVDNAGPDSNSDMKGNDDGNEFNKPGQSAKADPQDNNGASLDKPRQSPAGNIVIPPPNDDASPETQNLPEDGVFQEPPTRDDMNGKADTITEIPEKEDIVKKTSTGEANDDENMAVADINAVANYFGLSTADLADVIEYKCWAYISKKERDNMPKSQFGDPENEGFPVKDKKHYELAWRLVGRKPAADQARIKKNLARIGRENGWPIPESYTG